MSRSKNMTLLFTISLIFLSHVASSLKLYESVCNESKTQSQRCLKLLQDDPKITSATTYLTLSKSILENFVGKATNAQNQIKDLVKKYPTSKALKDCSTTYYGILIGSFNSAYKELTEDPETASYDVFAAHDGPQLCEDNLVDEKIVKEPSINTLNGDMLFLSVVASLAVNHLG